MRVDITDYMGYLYYFDIKNESYELFELCKPGDYVLDIGANIGWTALNLARLSQTGQVVGFEPDPYNLGRCLENLALNKLPNLTVLPFALGETSRRAQMELRSVSNRGGNRIAPGPVDADGETAEVRRLDDVDVVAHLPRIDLIKIDVEGYELKVLKGATTILANHKPTLFIEVDENNLRDQGDSIASVVSFLRDLGYASLVHAETKVNVLPTDDFSNCHFDIIARC